MLGTRGSQERNSDTRDCSDTVAPSRLATPTPRSAPSRPARTAGRSGRGAGPVGPSQTRGFVFHQSPASPLPVSPSRAPATRLLPRVPKRGLGCRRCPETRLWLRLAVIPTVCINMEGNCGPSLHCFSPLPVPTNTDSAQHLLSLLKFNLLPPSLPLPACALIPAASVGTIGGVAPKQNVANEGQQRARSPPWTCRLHAAAA